MKRILGLDLGVSSIGWAVIDRPETPEEQLAIVGIGSRIVPLQDKEDTNFEKGSGETVCHERTIKRGARRGLDRYQQRRESLHKILASAGLGYSADLLKLPPLSLWKLRADAASGIKLSPEEIGRVISHINQRRGYRHSKNDADTGDKKQSDYLSEIKGRAEEAKENGQTPGQYFFEKLKDSEYLNPGGGSACNFKIKEKVFPRKAYEDELKMILHLQSKHYPELLTEDICRKIYDIVFYQRPLKSCKHLVSMCQFESREIMVGDKTLIKGPRVAPVSSPLFQLCRIWETVNNIVLKNYSNKSKKKRNDHPEIPSLFDYDKRQQFIYPITLEERKEIVDFLRHNEKLTTANLFKILGLKKDDGFAVDKNVSKGIKGDDTYCQLKKALGDYPGAEQLLRFEIKTEENRADTQTGEIFASVSSSYLKEPIYRLWHTIYSISDKDELGNALRKKFGIEDQDVIDRLFNIDFRGKGYGNKSAKFICKLLPFLQSGLNYSEACAAVNVRHSDSLTKAENEARDLKEKLTLLNKGDLRQPLIEKVLNQMVHQVNAIKEKYGHIDEIRVELARSLKQSKENRASETLRNSARERHNKEIADCIQKEYGLKPSRNRIQKYRMWEESENKCMYCGQPIGVSNFLTGTDVEKEHVIPRSLFFDDSFSNKVCACRDCNHRKGQMTAYDFMQSEGREKFEAYLSRVNRLYDLYKSSKGRNGISKTKYERLMTSRNEIPDDFLNRDLTQSQYIARKAMEMLKEICRDVYASSGSVTDFFRHAWGYDEILHDLNLPAYSKAEQTEIVEFEHKGYIHKEERIEGWTKRLDHRHHAVDALVIALVTQKHIQRLNNLNKLYDKEDDGKGNGEETMYMRQARNLDRWAASQPHIPVDAAKDAIASIIVSFKAGVKATTPGKRIVHKGGKRVVAQTGILIPRGALTKESVYGVNRVLDPEKSLKDIFANPDALCSPQIRESVRHRLAEFGYDLKKAVASCKKRPLAVTADGDPISRFDCWKKDVVLRYKLSAIRYKDIDSIVDAAIKQKIKDRFDMVRSELSEKTGKEPGEAILDKEFAASLAENPIYSDAGRHHQISKVRCHTGNDLAKMMVVHRDNEGNPTGFSSFGSNHHIAIYSTPEGDLRETVVPFAHAVMRRQLGFPAVITDPEAVWDMVDNLKDPLPDAFLSNFPDPTWKHVVTMQINDMFIIGLTDEEIEYYKENDPKQLNAHIYRVQALSSTYYEFKKHTSTLSDKDNKQMANSNYIRVTSLKTFCRLNITKVRIDRLGNVIM